MKIFLDISAFLAILDADDSSHPQAKKIWLKCLEEDDMLFTSSSVFFETMALIQFRLSLEAVRVFTKIISPGKNFLG